MLETEVRLRRENGKLGYITLTLMWNTLDDLDLWCIVPNGSKIYYGNQQTGGGLLDVDMNAGGSMNCSKDPIENIYFPTKPEFGTYKVVVHKFKNVETPHGKPIYFTLTFRIGDTIHHEFAQVTGLKEEKTFLLNFPKYRAPSVSEEDGKTIKKKNYLK